MDLKGKFTFHRRLFLLLVTFSWILVVCFVTFQYGREKRFKAERLDAQLQLLNLRLLDTLSNGADAANFAAAHSSHFEGLRITVIAPNGEVQYDSATSLDSLSMMPNHASRPEVASAITKGMGYAIRRSESTGMPYFYSAMKEQGVIVRTALPYTISLREVLAADRGFLWFMFGITLLMCIAGYFVTRRLGHNIIRLRDFAERAERGEQTGDETFPSDELGEISSNIVRLYTQLQKATSERDRQYALTMHQEQEKIRIKRQLTTNINHELKTPVAAIQGYIETILANPQMGDAQRTAFLEKSSAQTDRLRRLLTDVATITRMEEASDLILTEPVILNEIIDEIRTDVQLLPPERRMRIHCDFVHPVIIEGSASLLASIFRNLIDNATAYSSGRDIFISIASEDDNCYTFTLADNGIGIDDEHLPRIFERFYRIDKGRSRKVGGTGLGLSIVKNAVLFHGGIIEARNRTEGGLEFQFTLQKK